jgi:predicted dinucleotide-binding enzyme
MLTELGRLTRDLAAAASRRARLIAVRGHGSTVLVAADDPEAKQALLALVEAAGLRGIVARPLRRARELEALGFLHMTLQHLGTNYASTVKLLG